MGLMKFPFGVVFPNVQQVDRGLALIVVIAALLSAVSFFLMFSQDLSLLYYDSQARLLITRRVVDSPTPGLAQLGGVWLPLTHLAAVPFIANDTLYQTGIALTWVSMVSFVITVIYIYKIAILLTQERGVGVLAAFIILSNPNMLYMQSTPMTEVPMFATMAAAVYYMIRLSREPENRVWLLFSGAAIALSTLIRYEAWLLLLAEAVILLYVCVRKRFPYSKIEGLFLFWSYVAFIGVLAWFVWNITIFGDALSFQRGEYAKPALWVSDADPNIGNMQVAFMSYAYAALSTVGPLFFVGLLGVVVYLFRTRFAPESLAPLALFSLFPFFVFMVYAGQRPLRVPELSGDMYNIRFGLIMVLPVSIFVAYLAHGSRLGKVLVALIIVGMLALMLRQHGVITIAEPASVQDTPRIVLIREAAAWLAREYDGAPMLMESYGNDELQFNSGIALTNIIYEGAYLLWDSALDAPHEHVDWVVMRNPPADVFDLVGADKVWARWHDDPTLDTHFEMVFANAMYSIYRRINSN